MLRLYWISQSAIHLSKFLIRVRRPFSPIMFPLILRQENQEPQIPAHFRSIHEEQNNVTGPIYGRLYRIRAPSVSWRRSKWLLKNVFKRLYMFSWHRCNKMTAGRENRIEWNKNEFVPNLQDIKAERRKLNFILPLFNEIEELSRRQRTDIASHVFSNFLARFTQDKDPRNKTISIQSEKTWYIW